MNTQQIPQNITPEYVRTLQQPTKGYLCPLEANIYGIEFVYFKIRNYDNDVILCEISKRPQDIGKPATDSSRLVKYHFGPFFFMLNMIGTTLGFRVGDKQFNNFKMIERHYFKNKLLKSYEFDVPFCMPKSQNTMQAIYELPNLSEEEIQDMINNPWQTVSDSFYFVEGKLVMHTKAEFSYADTSCSS